VATTGNVSLVVKDDQFLTRSKHGTIWGTIYFHISDNTFFPGTGWTDLVAAFVRVWLDQLQRIARRTTTKERVPFFDGPLFVDLSVLPEGLVELRFIHKEEVKTTVTVSILDLLRNAESAAESLLSMCYRKGWSNQDTEALKGLLQSGRQIH